MAADDTALTFGPLRAEGVASLQRMTREWTDHNAHDPGITILEQVCYALTDLGYRMQHSMPDLLAGHSQDPYASLYTPAAILPSGAVTLNDLRKVVLDVSGVKNAWIEPVDARVATFNATTREVTMVTRAADEAGPARSPNVVDIRPRGLYRVLIEKSDLIDIDGSEIRREAARRLHRHRGLGEDFVSVDVLDAQPVQIDAVIEIAAVGDAVDLLATIYERLALYCSPSVCFRTLDEMLSVGRRVDDIFEGPLLDHGFIDDGELTAAERRSTLRVSDLIKEVMTISGVVAVKKLRFIVNDQTSHDWLLAIEPARVARFDPKGSSLRLERGSLPVDSDALRLSARELFVRRARDASRPEVAPIGARDLPPPIGRDRRVGHYESIQHHFPMNYGVGNAGLSRTAPAERRARAKQLQAYLLVFDQLLANQFAQLANIGTLLSIHDDTTTSYFSQPVEDEGSPPLGLDAVRLHPDTHVQTLRRITENPGADVGDGAAGGVRRRNQMLDHLLARVGEQFSDYALLQFGRSADPATFGAQVAQDKRAFLREYPRLGRDRGVGFNYLEPASEGSSAFLPGDCLDPAGLARRWTASSPPDPVSDAMRSICTPEEQERLSRADSSREELEALVLDVLNRTLAGSLYDETRFAAVPRSAEAQRLLEGVAGGEVVDIVRLNRVLLEDAYPAEIARSRDADNLSGLELALRRKLGVRNPAERFYLVEHILLRPLTGDTRQQGPLFVDAALRDPYSLQITLVFPSWPARYRDSSFRTFVQETVRELAPAHLTLAIRWLDESEMAAFKQSYGVWLHRWRNHQLAELER